MMQSLSFYLLIPFIYLLSFLPFGILYGISDLMYLLVFHIIGYRKKVALQNLQKSFPLQTSKEIKLLCKQYYHYLCDLIFETVKTLTVNKEELVKRCKVNSEAEKLFAQLYAEKRSILLVMGHHGNWEWIGTNGNLQIKHQFFAIYKPLTNKFFDRLLYKARTRFGTKLISMNDTLRGMLNEKNNVSAFLFLSDQTPPPQNAYWTNFLNQETPVFWGVEKIAKKLNYPVVFLNVNRFKRGYYEISAELLVESPQTMKETEISETHTRRLEEGIIKRPVTWLWSHKRWKHKKSH